MSGQTVKKLRDVLSGLAVKPSSAVLDACTIADSRLVEVDRLRAENASLVEKIDEMTEDAEYLRERIRHWYDETNFWKRRASQAVAR